MVEFHNKGRHDTVGGDNWNKLISTLDAKKFKTEQNWADITSDSDNDEDELLSFCERWKIKGKWKERKLVVNVF